MTAFRIIFVRISVTIISRITIAVIFTVVLRFILRTVSMVIVFHIHHLHVCIVLKKIYIYAFFIKYNFRNKYFVCSLQ